MPRAPLPVSDVVRLFLDSRTEWSPSTLANAALFAAFRAWNREHRHPDTSHRVLSRTMYALGYSQARLAFGRGWRGLALVSDSQAARDERPNP